MLPQHKQALARAVFNSDMAGFFEVLQEVREDEMSILVNAAGDEQLRNSQGKMQIIGTLFEIYENPNQAIRDTEILLGSTFGNPEQ